MSEEKNSGETTEISDLERKIRLLLQLPTGEEGSPAGSQEAIDERTREEAQAILKEFRRELFPERRWINFASGEVAIGYQRNVLKEETNAVDSSYLTSNVEASTTLLHNRKPLLNLYAVAEHREYLEQTDIPSEDFVLLYNSIALGKDPDNLFTVESTAFYVRQVLEDPLQEGGASLFSLWNVRVRTGIQFARGDHSLFVGHVYSRELYDEENLDYSSGGLFFRWNWKVRDSLKLKNELEYAPRKFDDRVARLQNGVPVEGVLLRLDRLSLDFRLSWEPSMAWLKEVSSGLQLTGEWSDESDYDTNLQLQFVNQLEFSWKNFVFGPRVKGSYRDYKYRQISFNNAETQEQWRWSTVFFLEYTLNDSIVFDARYEFESSASNRDSLDYRSDSFQISTNYTF